MTFDEWWVEFCDGQYHEDYGLAIQPRDAAEASWNMAIENAAKAVEVEDDHLLRMDYAAAIRARKVEK